MYMVVVDTNGAVKTNRRFDTYFSESDAVKMNEFLSSTEVKLSDIVLITSYDSINKFLQLALPGIHLLTCGDLVSGVRVRDTLTIIGRKAAPCPPWFVLKHVKAGQGPVSVEMTINKEF